MPRFHTLMPFALLAHAGLTVAVADEAPILAAVLGAGVFLSLIGAVLMAGGNASWGAKLFIVGCVPFVPLGIVGILAARRAVDGPRGVEPAVAPARQWQAEFRTEAKYPQRIRILGWMFLALGAAKLVAQGMPSAALLAGIFCLVGAAWQKNNPIVIVYFDHVDIKSSLLAPRKVVRLSEVRELATEGLRKAFLVLDDGSRIRLPLKQLDPNDRSRMIQTLQELRARPL